MKIQSTDTTSLNRIKRIINEVYLDEVVPAQQWKWLRKRINLSHTPKITTGTVSVTQHSPNLTFSIAPGLSQQGCYFSVDGSNDVYRVLSHTANSTTAVLEVPYTQATATAASFKLWSEGIPLPSDCRETFQVLQYNSDVPLEGVGLNKFREITITQPKAEGPPQWYTTTDFRDPDPYSSISSLPALTTRASSGVIKTLVFASDVSSYLREGDRIRIDTAGHYSYGGEAIVSNVSTTTLTYTGTIEYLESAVADATLTVKLFNQEKSSERYRELLVYPSIYDQRVTLHLDYIQEVPPLENASDEPMMPISDRIILKYGALKEAWAFFDRNEEEASRYEAKFQQKLARMSGGLDDSTDMPTLTPSKLYMGSKRNQTRTRDTKRFWGNGISSGGTSSQPTITSTASRVAVFDGTGTLTASTAIDTTELAKLDGILSTAVGISDTQTLTNKTINASLNTISNIVNANVGSAAAIAYSKLALTNSIVNADIGAAAAIAYSKLNLALSIVNADIAAGAAIAYSKLALTGTLVNADVSASAAIAYSKLALSNSIVNADVAAGAAIAYSKLNLGTSIVNADINGSAAIAYSKLNLGTSIVNADVSTTAAIVSSKLLKSVVAKTGNYTATTADDTINCSGAAFTVTLYAASGNSGKRLIIRKTDSSLTNIITLDGNASETINGSLTTTLNTQNETIEIECDGSNWFIVERYIPSDWVTYTPVFGAGFGTAASISFFSRRVGDSLQVQGKWTNGTVAASAATVTVGFAGTSGNVTIDTAKVPPSSLIGTAQTSLTSTTYFGAYPIAPASNLTTFSFAMQTSAAGFGGGAQLGNAFSATGAANSVSIIVPIVGWFS